MRFVSAAASSFAFQGQDLRQQLVRVSVFWIELDGPPNVAFCFA
jgi:hypothetical protein